MQDEGGRLDASLLGVGGVEHLHLVVVTFGPSGVHAQQHLGEVGSIHATGLGTHGDDCLTLVVLAGEQGANLEGIDLVAHPLQLLLGLLLGVLVVTLGGKLEQDGDVLKTRTQLLQTGQLSLQGGQPRGHLLGVLLVVPQIGGSSLLLQLGDLFLLRLWIENELDRLQGVIELINGLLQVYQCHNKLLYRLFGSGAHAHDAGAHSSVGQSACLTRRRSSVRDRLCPPR